MPDDDREPASEKPAGDGGPVLLRDVYPAGIAGGWLAIIIVDSLPALAGFVGAAVTDFSWGTLWAVLELPLKILLAGFMAGIKILLGAPLAVPALAAGFYAARHLRRRQIDGLAPLALAGLAAGFAGGIVPVFLLAGGEGPWALTRLMAFFCVGGALAGFIYWRRLRLRAYFN